MLFTVLNNCILLFLCLVINLVHNQSYELQKETFGNTFYTLKGLFLMESSDKVTPFCETEVESMTSEESFLKLFQFFVALTALGGLTSLL